MTDEVEKKTVMFVSPEAPYLRVKLPRAGQPVSEACVEKMVSVKFAHGRLEISDENQLIYLRKQLNEGSALCRFIREVDLERAARVVAEHQALMRDQQGAVQGSFTSDMISAMKNPNARERMRSEMLLNGVLPAEIEKALTEIGSVETTDGKKEPVVRNDDLILLKQAGANSGQAVDTAGTLAKDTVGERNPMAKAFMPPPSADVKA